MNITCVTSRYLPNLRHIARLLEVETTIILDLAPLPHRNRDSFVYRNRIMSKTGSQIWLSLPVNRKGVSAIKDAKIDTTNRTWADKHIKSLSYFYPNHKSIAGNFLEKLRDCLTMNNGTLIDINFQILKLILETLGYSNINILLQSSLVNIHTTDHRLEMAKILGASEYTAGQVEWNILNDSRLLLHMLDSGVKVIRSPDLSVDVFPKELTVNLSSIHSICLNGIEKTQGILEQMIKSLKNIS